MLFQKYSCPASTRAYFCKGVFITKNLQHSNHVWL